jgi:NitT/TauT family transport system substrate-binding protein
MKRPNAAVALATLAGLALFASACGSSKADTTTVATTAAVTTEAPTTTVAAATTAHAPTSASTTSSSATTTATATTSAVVATTKAVAAVTTTKKATTTTVAAAPAEKVTLRLGYFPNVTHATALVGVANGIFTKNLGPNVTLDTKTFNAGTAALESLLADAIDASYIGPNPAINGFVKSKGAALRIVSGATSGGAFLVVKPEINAPADLKGRTLATPQLGNTQDVALRAWLQGNGLSSDTAGGGDVTIRPQDNAATLDAFKQGKIDGGWLPEPWATRLVQEGGGKVLVDERDLWPQGQYVTTQLIVAKKFLDKHPDVVKALLRGQVEANAFVLANPGAAQKAVNAQITAITGKGLADGVLASSWKNLRFTNDPVASSLRKSADDATAVGLLAKADLTGIYDLTLLNEVLAESGKPPVKGL